MSAFVARIARRSSPRPLRGVLPSQVMMLLPSRPFWRRSNWDELRSRQYLGSFVGAFTAGFGLQALFTGWSWWQRSLLAAATTTVVFVLALGYFERKGRA